MVSAKVIDCIQLVLRPAEEEGNDSMLEEDNSFHAECFCENM